MWVVLNALIRSKGVTKNKTKQKNPTKNPHNHFFLIMLNIMTQRKTTNHTTLSCHLCHIYNKKLEFLG